MLNFPNEIAKDGRITTYLLPTDIKKTWGNVGNTERLLKQPRFMQINIPENDVCSLENGDSGENAAILLDFGRELQGGVRILSSINHPAETYPKILIRFGESCIEALTPVGTNNVKNDHTIHDYEVPVSPMSDQTFGQTGFRFVYIELLDKNAKITLKNIFAAFTYRDLPYLGSFSCDDQELCDIFNVAAYTCHLCMQNYLWDGIKRDRLVWIGDSHVESKTIRSIFGNNKIINESMDEAVDAYPLPSWMQLQSYSYWWVLVLYDWYKSTGDSYLINKHKDYVIGLFKQTIPLIDNEGNFLTIEGFFDHEHQGFNPFVNIGVSAVISMALERMSEIFEILGEAELSSQAAEIAEKMVSRNVQPTGEKTVDAMLYLSGTISSTEVLKTLDDGSVDGFSAFLSYYVFKALCLAGKRDEALRQLKKFYGGMLKLGATTFWEAYVPSAVEGTCRIDEIPKEGEKCGHGAFGEGMCYEGLRNSLCHGWSSGAVPFIVEEILGISYDPISKKLTIKPDLCGLKWAKATYPLEDGEVLTLEIEQTEKGLKINHSQHEGIEIEIL